jgi:thioredoxin-related protein
MISYVTSVLISLYTMSSPVWMTNMDSARAMAKKDHKLILLYFSGSDWCIPCISLRNAVYNTEAFTKFAGDNIILVNADFPRKKKNQLSKEQQAVNDKLAEQYNPTGIFPYTLLLDSDGKKIKTWEGYYKNGPDSFINEVRSAGGLN